MSLPESDVQISLSPNQLATVAEELIILFPFEDPMGMSWLTANGT